METSPDPECTCDPHPLDDPCDACRPEDQQYMDALDRLERSIRNYHDSGCFIYLPSGACDCGMSVDQDALAALATVREALERQREELDDLRDEYMADAGLRTAAEAEVRRLTEGLRWVEEMTAGRAGVSGIADHVRALLSASPSDGGGVCDKCGHAAHKPGDCPANVGTGYFGPVLCRCGVEDGGGA